MVPLFPKAEEQVEAPADCWRHPLPQPRDARNMKGALQGTVTLPSQFSHEDVWAYGAGPSPLRIQFELNPSVLERFQDFRLREAGAEVVYCLTRGAPKGPTLPRARLNHQDALFPGHGKATHSQTYLYTQAASLVNIPQALHTRMAAKMFRVSRLVEACDAFLGTSLQPADVCYVLEYTIAKGSTKTLDSLIDKHRKENAGQVIKGKEFIAASEGTVLRILKNPCLRLRESDVVEAVYSWATVHCSQASDETPITALRRTMRPFLPELRSFSLTPLEFVEGPSCWQILTKRDTQDVLSNIIKPGSENSPEGISANREERTNPHSFSALPAIEAPRVFTLGGPPCLK
ncbi:uncharacterized protein ISCGN_022279 [Ixodes scapularis]